MVKIFVMNTLHLLEQVSALGYDENRGLDRIDNDDFLLGGGDGESGDDVDVLELYAVTEVALGREDLHPGTVSATIAYHESPVAAHNGYLARVPK